MAEPIKKRPAVFTTISSLRPDTTGHNLKVKVVDAKLVLNRPTARPVGNSPTRIAECTVGDETGVIVFTARNDQVDLCQPGASLVLRNARIDMFRGSMRLSVTQWGKLEASEQPYTFKPQVSNNLSLIEYELVPVPAQASQASASNANGIAA